MTGVHRLILKNCHSIHLSSYAVRPKPVFENAIVDVSILLFTKTGTPCKHLFSTKMYRRDDSSFSLQKLIDNIEFVEVGDYLLEGRIPKISYAIEKSILKKVWQFPLITEYYDANGKQIFHRTSGGRYFKVVTNYPTGSTTEKADCFKAEYANAIGCILSSNLSFWFYQIYSDNLHWKKCEFESFRIPTLTKQQIDTLEALYNRYLVDIENNANTRSTSGKSSLHVSSFKEYKIVHSKHIIDEIDDYLGPLYGLTAEEVDFVKNYELRFRMSGERGDGGIGGGD